MKELQQSQFHNFEKTWNKLESSMNISTIRNLPSKPIRPTTGRIKKTRNLSMDFPSTKPDTRRTSRLNLSASSFMKAQTTRNSIHNQQKSTSLIDTIPSLSHIQIQQIYNAKCFDLEILPFPEQEKRFFSYCFKHFYDRNFELIESGLGFESAKVIGNILQTSSEFSYVKLGKNTLGNVGFVEIMKGIYKNNCIVHVDFSSNEITYNGLQESVDYFTRNESIISIDISSHKGLHRNRFGPKGAECIGKILENSNILCILNISGTTIGDDGLEYLLNGIASSSTLIDLNLSNNGIGPDKIPDLVKSISLINLTKLNLSVNKIGNDGADSICELLMGLDSACTIEILDVSYNEITTKGISRIFYSLTNNQTLSNLNISNNFFGTGLSNNFYSFIVENSGVKILNLSGCQIKSHSLTIFPDALPKNRTLEELDLSGNNIDDNGVEAICIGLSRNLGLKKLNLSYNFIKERGGKSFANCFKMNHSLAELNLRENNINDEAGQLLEDICRKNRNLLELNLELNPLALKFVFNIKDSLKKNKLQKEKKVIPELKSKLSNLTENTERLLKLKNNINNKRAEFNDLTKKIEKNSERMKTAANEEQKKNEVVRIEYEDAKKRNFEVSKELEDIIIEITVKNILERKEF